MFKQSQYMQTLKKIPGTALESETIQGGFYTDTAEQPNPGFNNMEQWKIIEEFPNYLVSNRGRIISKKRIVLKSDGSKQPIRARYLKINYDAIGYPMVNLSKMGKQRTKTIHRLMLIAFTPNPENKPMTNHINGIKDDNRIGNLEWVSAKENTQHAFKIGLMKKRFGEDVHNSLLSNKEVLEIRELLKYKGFTHKKIGKQFGVSSKVITGINIGFSYKPIH